MVLCRTVMQALRQMELSRSVKITIIQYIGLDEFLGRLCIDNTRLPVFYGNWYKLGNRQHCLWDDMMYYRGKSRSFLFLRIYQALKYALVEKQLRIPGEWHHDYAIRYPMTMMREAVVRS